MGVKREAEDSPEGCVSQPSKKKGPNETTIPPQPPSVVPDQVSMALRKIEKHISDPKKVCV